MVMYFAATVNNETYYIRVFDMNAFFHASEDADIPAMDECGNPHWFSKMQLTNLRLASDTLDKEMFG